MNSSSFIPRAIVKPPDSGQDCEAQICSSAPRCAGLPGNMAAVVGLMVGSSMGLVEDGQVGRMTSGICLTLLPKASLVSEATGGGSRT